MRERCSAAVCAAPDGTQLNVVNGARKKKKKEDKIHDGESAQGSSHQGHRPGRREQKSAGPGLPKLTACCVLKETSVVPLGVPRCWADRSAQATVNRNRLVIKYQTRLAQGSGTTTRIGILKILPRFAGICRTQPERRASRLAEQNLTPASLTAPMWTCSYTRVVDHTAKLANKYYFYCANSSSQCVHWMSQ